MIMAGAETIPKLSLLDDNMTAPWDPKRSVTIHNILSV